MTGAAAEDLGAFLDDARVFLDGAVPRRTAGNVEWGVGSDRIGIMEEFGAEEERAFVARACDWQRAKYDAGFGWVTGPPAFGGRGLDLLHDLAFAELEAEYETPDSTPMIVGLGMVAPTILEHGPDPLRGDLLPRLYRGDLVACQLFSEPSAGSDLAAVATRATRDGDRWVINGQKVWTSWAYSADIGLLLARSNREVAKHAGMTMFVVDMNAAGVDVRPLRQMTGGSGFCEVFFDDVAIPDTRRIGDVDAGWATAITTLSNERAALSAKGSELPIPRLAQAVRRFGPTDDRLTSLGRLARDERVRALTSQRALEMMKAGEPPGPALSAGKILLSRGHRAASRLVQALMADRLLADEGEWGTFAWNEYVLGVPGTRIAGGTDEIQRNIIAERVLGLPREPRAAETS